MSRMTGSKEQLTQMPMPWIESELVTPLFTQYMYTLICTAPGICHLLLTPLRYCVHFCMNSSLYMV